MDSYCRNTNGDLITNIDKPTKIRSLVMSNIMPSSLNKLKISKIKGFHKIKLLSFLTYVMLKPAYY